MKVICGVYKITNIENGLIYIGSSKNIKKRWKNHIKELNNNRHSNMFLQKDWNEYGENKFKFEILEETELDERWEVEQRYLDEYKPFYRVDKGYNINEKSTYRNPTSLRIFNSFDDDYNFNCKIAKVKGCRPMILDYDDFLKYSREEIEDMCYAKQAFYDLRDYMLESGADVDDWL